MVPIGGGSTKFDRLILYTKSRKQLLHRKYLLYETGCMYLKRSVSRSRFQNNWPNIRISIGRVRAKKPFFDQIQILSFCCISVNFREFSIWSTVLTHRDASFEWHIVSFSKKSYSFLEGKLIFAGPPVILAVPRKRFGSARGVFRNRTGWGERDSKSILSSKFFWGTAPPP